MRVSELTWSTEFNIGITALDDEQHRLFSLFNTLARLSETQESADCFLKTFERFVDALDEHFAHEERVLRNIGFPDYAAHKAAHDHFLTDAHDFYDSLRRGSLTSEDFPTIARYVRYWLLHHVQHFGRRVDHFVNAGWPACRRIGNSR